MIKEARKQADGSIIIMTDGKATDVIRKAARGYSKAIILQDGREFIPPLYSHFGTLKQALAFCGVK